MAQSKRKPIENHLRVIRDGSENIKKRKKKKNVAKTINQKVSRYSQGGKKEYRFLWRINFDFKTIIDRTWEIDIIDLSIFYAIRSIIMMLKHNKDERYDHYKTIDMGREWYFIVEDKIIQDLPLIPIHSSIGIRKRIDKLIACGLIERNHRNEILRKRLIDLGHNAHLVKGSFSKV